MTNRDSDRDGLRGCHRGDRIEYVAKKREIALCAYCGRPLCDQTRFTSDGEQVHKNCIWEGGKYR